MNTEIKEENVVSHVSEKLGITFFLHNRGGETKDGIALRKFWFFYPSIIEESVVLKEDMPEGFHVVENIPTGMPFLKRKEL